MKLTILAAAMITAAFLCPAVHAQVFQSETPQNASAFVFAAPDTTDTQTAADPSETASTEAWEALGVTAAALLIFHSHSGGDSSMNTTSVVPVPEQNTGLTFGLLGACGYTGMVWTWRKQRRNERKQSGTKTESALRQSVGIGS